MNTMLVLAAISAATGAALVMIGGPVTEAEQILKRIQKKESRMKKLEHIALKVVFTIAAGAAVLAACLALSLLTGCENPFVCHRAKVVKAIGACDRDGVCGVVLDDDTKGLARYPVLGEMTCAAERPRF